MTSKFKFESDTRLILVEAPLFTYEQTDSNRYREVSGASVHSIAAKVSLYNLHNGTNVQYYNDDTRDSTYIYL